MFSVMWSSVSHSDWLVIKLLLFNCRVRLQEAEVREADSLLETHLFAFLVS